MSFIPTPPSDGGNATAPAENTTSSSSSQIPPLAATASGLTIRISRPTTSAPATPPPTAPHASAPLASSSRGTVGEGRGEGSDKRRRIDNFAEGGATVPAPTTRAVTPPRASSSAHAQAVTPMARTMRHGAERKPPSTVRGETKRKPTFTTVLSFHKPDGAPSVTPAESEEKELGRASRRSKVQAISKLDRAGTPGSVTSGGATGTSFVPSKAGTMADAGPGPSRNPLHRAPIVNPPFDINTIRTSAPRHPAPRTTSRLFGLREAPTYYPTPEQFADPLAYVASLPAEARAAGICKVVPPEGWKMPFCVESDTFRFKTRLQRLNQLEAASRAKVNFLEQLTMFHMQQGDATVTIPVIDRRPLDVWRLRKEVTKMGGYDNVTAIKGWERITELMGYAVGWAPEFKSAYARIVLPFEKYSARAKSQSASPLTPLSTKKSETQRPPGWAMTAPGSPTAANGKPGRMGAVKMASGKAKGSRMSGISTRPRRGGSPPPPTSVSLPEVKSLDFASTSGSRSATPQPATAGPRLRIPGFSDREGTDSDLSDDSLSPPPPPAKKLPEEPYQKGEVCEVCRRGNEGDKILLCDGCDRGYHIFCLDPPLAAVPTNEEWYCTPCLLSQGDDFGFEEGEEHSLASFAARDQAFSEAWWHKFRGHRAAQQADANGIPPTPLRADEENGQRAPSGSRSPSTPLSPIASINGQVPPDGQSSAPSAAGKRKAAPINPLSRRFGKAVVNEDDVEREFWRLTESSYDTVEVEYGADVHSTTHGSAAPTMETHPRDPYSKDGWNLNNMPILPDSVLRYIKSDISGMTVPWIYIGMMFSAFCWHNEDHYTYSINYMFWGETKTWYGIPGADAERFEAAIKGEAPELFEQQPGLLYQLVTMMNPGRLKEEGVDVLACDQRPNEFVITFPKAYHCGFNHGINFNEAVNFALPDWLSEGKEAVRKYREYAKAPVFSHNELLISITLYSDTIKTALWLRQSLADMVAAEAKDRDQLRARITNLAEKLEEEDCPEEQYQCCVCKAFSYLSQVTCKCTKLVACLEHADQLCACSSSSRVMRKRYSESQLEEILAIVETRAAIPGAWRERFEAVLSTRRPMLKTMRGLLTDGERMPYPLTELNDLRIMVARANAWVDRVQTLSQRKTAVGRRRKRQETDDDEFARTPEYVKRLLQEVDRLSFDAPEIHKLRDEVASIDTFKHEARLILSTEPSHLDIQQCQTAVILGQGLMVEMPEVAQIQTLVNRLQWFRQVEDEVDDRTLQYDQVVKLLKEAKEFGIPDDHETTSELRKREAKGRAWKQDVERLEKAESITIAELDSLIDGQELTPTDEATMHNLENISRNVQHWRTQASVILAKNGTAASAQRLVKAVSTAGGIAGKVIVPEIDELSRELDFHDEWLAQAANILGESPNRVSSRLTDILNNIRQRLSIDDVEPNEDRTCFCRTSTASPGMLICCDTCEGWYHPKCVNLNSRKEMPAQWKCPMCANAHGVLDGRPSLHDLAGLTDKRWNLIIQPSELATLWTILDLAIEAGRVIVPLLRLVEPVRAPLKKRPIQLDDEGKEVDEEKAEMARVTHWCRKLYTMPINFDAVNNQRNERIVFEEWLFRRMRQARQPLMPTPPPEPPVVEIAPLEPVLDKQELSVQHQQLLANGVPIMSEKMRLSRSRRPKLILAEAHEKQMACICIEPPVDALIKVWCNKCEQGYHASCVSAPLDSVSNGPQGKDFVPVGGPASTTATANANGNRGVGERKAVNWRCPCCTVKEGKFFLKGVELRVQMMDTYVDYRATVANYVAAPVLLQLPPVPCIKLHCVQFIPAVRPEDVVAPNRELAPGHAASAALGQVDSPANKKRRTDSDATSGTVPAVDIHGFSNGAGQSLHSSTLSGVLADRSHLQAQQARTPDTSSAAYSRPGNAYAYEPSKANDTTHSSAHLSASSAAVVNSHTPSAQIQAIGTMSASSRSIPVANLHAASSSFSGSHVQAVQQPAQAPVPTHAQSHTNSIPRETPPQPRSSLINPASSMSLSQSSATAGYRSTAIYNTAQSSRSQPAFQQQPAQTPSQAQTPQPQSSYTPQRNIVSPSHPVHGLHSIHTTPATPAPGTISRQEPVSSSATPSTALPTRPTELTAPISTPKLSPAAVPGVNRVGSYTPTSTARPTASAYSDRPLQVSPTAHAAPKTASPPLQTQQASVNAGSSSRAVSPGHLPRTDSYKPTSPRVSSTPSTAAATGSATGQSASIAGVQASPSANSSAAISANGNGNGTTAGTSVHPPVDSWFQARRFIGH